MPLVAELTSRMADWMTDRELGYFGQCLPLMLLTRKGGCAA